MGTRAHRGQRGFTLVEAMVGLTLLGLVLVFSLAVLYRVPRHLHRVAARQEANRAAEAVLESVRAGAVPMSPGYAPYLLPEHRTVAARQLRIWLEIEATSTPDLYMVGVLVRYKVLDEPRTVTVETLKWAP